MQCICLNTLQVWLHKHTEFRVNAICALIHTVMHYRTGPAHTSSFPPTCLTESTGIHVVLSHHPLPPKLHAYKREWKGKFRRSVSTHAGLFIALKRLYNDI